MTYTNLMSTAQDTIGKLIAADSQRDAIHIALAPVVATTRMKPGDRVGLTAAGAVLACSVAPTVGIVDPFLGARVEAGDRFWLFLLPNTVTGMRHEWQHPAFPQEGRVYLPAGANAAEKWIREYARDIGLDYEDLMDGAASWLHSKKGGGWGDYLVRGGLLEGMSTKPEFWTHYATVTGKDVPEEHRESFFSCSC